MSIQFAARELLLQIFKYLPRPTLLNCASVCQTWQRPALQLFYEHVELSEKTKPIWLHLIHGTSCIDNNVGIFVRKLTVSLAFSTTMTQVEFLKVLSYLPFVKSIDLKLSGYKLHYLAYLNKRELGCVTYLEEIYTGDLFTDYQMQQYFLCAYSFRHSLKNLTLRNPLAVYDLEGHQVNALSLLDRFESLDRISVISDSPADNNELCLLMDAFGARQGLTHFSYKNNCLQMHHQPNYEESDQLQKAKRPLVKLHTIELDMPVLTEHYIKNILYTFPVHLKTLYITMTHTDYTSWIQNCNELFGVYLGYVKKLKMSISNFNRRGFRNSSSITHTPQELEKFWLMIQSIMGGKRLVCQLKFTFHKPGTSPDFCIEKDEQQQRLTLSYNVDTTQDMYTCLEELSSGVTFDSIIFALPSQKEESVDTVKRCLEIINTRIPHALLFQFSDLSKENESYIELGSLYDSPSFAYAVLKNISFDLFSSISNLLPKVKLLKLTSYSNFDQHQENGFVLDLTTMNHLNQLVLEFDSLKSYYPVLVVKVQVISTDQVKYYNMNMVETTDRSDIDCASRVYHIKCHCVQEVIICTPNHTAHTTV